MTTHFMTRRTRKVPPNQHVDLINARLPEGTLNRMDKVLMGGELRSAFIRMAVDKELRRREAALAK